MATNLKKYLGIFLPSLLSVALFGVSVFCFVLPQTEQAILASKKEMISELTLSACSMLATYHQQEHTGVLTRAEAQQRALSRLRNMRYGKEGKDYFWVTDLTPRMVMHPYRPEMEGQDLSAYMDPKGHRFFQEYTQRVKEAGQGFVSYLWQWKNVASRQAAPKTSHVRLFEPWGWVVGTGIYTDDVAASMAGMTKHLVLIGVLVMILVVILSFYIAWRGIKADRERQAAQDAMMESEERFRSISANALDGIVMIDPQGRISFWNQAAANMFGYSEEEVLGSDMHLLITDTRYHEPYRSAHKVFQETGQGRAIGNTLELSGLTKEGKELPIELSLAPMNLRGGWHAVGIVRDITQRKQAEASLLSSEEKFRKLFYGSPVMLSITTRDEGRYLEVNDAAINQFGFTREEVIGKTPLDLGLFEDPQQIREVIEKRRRDAMPVRYEATMLRGDGSRMEALISSDPMEYDGRACVISVIVDISESKKAAEEKRQLEEQLRQAQKMEAVGTLAGGIAHDFNNILSAVLGYSELALDGLPTDGKTHKYISQVYSAGLRARDLVQQILAFSRQAKVEKSPLEVRLLIKEALKMLRAAIPTTINIIEDIDKTKGRVLADPSQLHQIMLNLCTNAAHAMRETGGSLRVGLHEVAVPVGLDPGKDQPAPGEYLSLSVNDTGCGMSPQTMEHIFEPFFTTKGTGEGTGLGLSVVHGIVQELGGWTSVQSSEGQGTTFTVLLPKYQGEDKTQTDIPPALLTGDEHILVVDDEVSVAQTHRLMLESLGYQVTALSSSQQAWQLLYGGGEAFDLLITDLSMPQMDGIQLIRNLRRNDLRIPVILATGFADERNLKPTLMQELGISRLISKPIVLSEFAQIVRQSLDKSL